MLLFGAIWGSDTNSTVSSASWLMVGIVVQNIVSSGLIGDSNWLAYTRDLGVLRRVRATPLPVITLIGAYVLIRLLLILLQSMLIIAIGILVFGAQITWGGLIPAIIIGICGGAVFLALGQAIAAAAPRATSSNYIAQLIYYPLIFLSNLFIGITVDWLKAIARWSPAYMLVDLLRPALLPMSANQPAWLNLTGLLLYGLVGMILAAHFFRWEPKT
jgi:ABC-2 type transport system permease protein